MDPRLDFFLSRVSKRFQQLRLAQSLAVFWLLLGGLLFLLWRFNPEFLSRQTLRLGELFGNRWLATGLIVAIPAISLLAIFVAVRSMYRDRRRLAMLIEERYPALDHRLLTSLGVDVGSTSPFLRRSLCDETILHAATHDWRQVISSKSLSFHWVLQTISFLLAVGAIALLATGGWNRSPLPSVLGIQSSNGTMIVEPGDVDIERGSTCLITARFQQSLPADVILEYRVADAEASSIELTRPLNDPVFATYLPRVTLDTTYRIIADGDISRDYHLRVFDYPALVRSDAKIEPPKYSMQATRTVNNTRRVTVPEASNLTWRCEVNKPLAEVYLEDEEGKQLPLTCVGANSLVYEITLQIEENQQWKLRLIDEAGRNSKVEETLIAKVLRNGPPNIKIEGASDLSVSPIEEVMIKAGIRDDFGLVRTGVTYQLASSDAQEFAFDAVAKEDLGTSSKGDNRVKDYEVKQLLDFEAMGAEPDELLSYYFWAEDLDREGNVRRVDSELYFAEVRPFDEIFREGQSQESSQSQQSQGQSPQAQQATELAELQKKIITATWNQIRKHDKTLMLEDIRVIFQSQSDALEQSAELDEQVQDEQSRAFLDGVREAMLNAMETLAGGEGKPWKLDRESTTDKPTEPGDVPLAPDSRGEGSSNVASGLSESKTVDASEARVILQQALGFEQKAYEGLLRLRAREHQITRSRNQQSRSSSASQRNRQQQIDQLKLDDEQERYESEQQAQQDASAENRELRQVMSRLDELARRQEDINRQLKDLEAAIQEADTQDEKEELEEQLKRLRENQEEMLRDTDELLERMEGMQSESQQTQEAIEKAQQQVQQARSEVEQASQALSQSQPSASQALSSGSRAQQQLDTTREQLREESAERFEESMRSMLDQAQKLEKRQEELTKEIRSPNESSSSDQASKDSRNSELAPEENERGGLRNNDSGEAETDSDRERDWKEQQENLSKLLNEVQETVSEAETSEPLLADKLYETYRTAQQQGLDERLDLVPQLLERGYRAPVDEALNDLSKGMQELREGIESAADGVLGSEEAGLRRAVQELAAAEKKLNQELPPSRASNPEETPNDPNATSNSPKSQEQANGDSSADKPSDQSQASNESSPERPDRPANQAAGQSDTQSSSPGSENQNPSSNPSQLSQAPQQDGQSIPQNSQQASSQNSSQSDSRPGESQTPSSRSDGQSPSSNGNQPTNPGRQRDGGDASRAGAGFDSGIQLLRSEGPFIGGGFIDWTDSLREVEESVRDPEFRARAEAIREAAREIYRDARRHGNKPQWDLVRELVSKPLSELKKDVEVELLRKSADRNALVPIDRDPVPTTFEERQRQYYENLSSRSNAP